MPPPLVCSIELVESRRALLQGKICPTFKSTYNIQLTADLSANHSSAEISLIFGLYVCVCVWAHALLHLRDAAWDRCRYNIVITPRGANAMFAKDPRSACDNLMVRG